MRKFLSGFRKLLSKENNWTFLQPLVPLPRLLRQVPALQRRVPGLRGERKAGDIPADLSPRGAPPHHQQVPEERESKLLAKLTASDIELNFTLLARLAELAYRCTLCRRCAQVCPLGVDNGLISREIRKLFSQEMGIAPKELHEKGTVQQLKVGSSTGMTPKALENIIDFMEDDIEEKTGKRIKIPVDKEGADILLVHNAGEFLAWPENPEAFAIIFRRGRHRLDPFERAGGLRRGQLRRMV